MKKTTRHLKNLKSSTCKIRDQAFLHWGKKNLSVTMSLTWGQYAWFSTWTKQDHMENHQRLHVEKHSPDWKLLWLVGFTDGDGTFSVDRQRKKNGTISWNLVFKISMKHFNKRALIRAKSIVGAGKVEPSTPDGMVTFCIPDRAVLKKHVFPIFDRFPLLSNKHYDYVRLRQIASLLDDDSLSRKHRDEKIEFLYSLHSSRDAVAPIWHQKFPFHDFHPENRKSLDFTKPQVQTVMSVPWVSGFLEAKGCFYIVRKEVSTGRYCHAFGVIQKGNHLVMEALRCYLKIGAQVQFYTPKSVPTETQNRPSFYKIETTNWRTLQHIRDIFVDSFLGMKSLEFRIWERSLKFVPQYDKLRKIQLLLRRIRKRWQIDEIENQNV